MAKKNRSRSCTILFGMLGIGGLIGFFIYFGLPKLSAKTPLFPPTPGIDPKMDQLWFGCAINASGWAQKCDDLITNDPDLAVYRSFGSTCGGRYENIWSVKCTDLIPIITQAPLNGLPVLAWQNKTIKTICLEVNESYDSIDEDLQLLQEHIDWLLFDRYYLGIVAEGCDAALQVDAIGTPISARYFPAGLRYTGAEVQGKVSLTATGFQTLTSTFQGQVDPPEKFAEWEGQDKYSSPSEAPFREAIESEILTILTEWFGPAILE